MSDFVAFTEDIDGGMEILAHFGILGMKHGKRNGPPYPLGSGDHSAGEKAAAKAAGVTVGSDSGKGSIENVKKTKRSKSPSKPLTPEERRAAALEAVSKGDKKKITKNMDQLSTDELRDAEARAKLKESLERDDPNKKSKADKDKEAAIRSGDKAKIQEYADKMSYNELAEAMNKMNLMAQLNYVAPPPTAMDRLKQAADAAGKFKDVAEKGIGAYNVLAKVMNAANKDSKWPIIGEKPKEEKKDGEKDKEKEKTKEAVKTVVKEVTKSYEEQAKEKFKNAKTDYKYEKKLEDWKTKQEARRAKGEDIEDDDDDTPASTSSSSSSSGGSTESKAPASTSESSRQYTPERAPQLKKTYFNTKKEEPAKSTEPTEEQKRILESERKKDAEYLNQMKMTTKTPSFDEIFSESYKESQRNMSFEKAMEEYDWQDTYDYYMRHSEE